MSGYSRVLLAAVLAVALAPLAACSSSTPSPSSDPGAATAGAGQTTPADPAKPALPTNGKCVLIATDKAAALVGSTVTSSSSNVTGTEGIVRIDGCTYVGTASNLGYDINNVTGGNASAFITQAKAQMAGQPGVTPFDVTGGDSSIGFTVPIGPKVMARIEVVKGSYTIAVNSTAADAETAKKISNGALAVLLDAIP